jgi:hypothetical protein
MPTCLMLTGLKTDPTVFNGQALRRVFSSPTGGYCKSLSRLDSTWREIGTRTELIADITAATGIPGPAFTSLRHYSIAQIMSWASMRRTSRVEDLAYCLFDVGIPLLYGEGERAFRRLWEETMRIPDDESIFVWTTNLREEAMAVKKLQENIAISMNDESVYAIPNETIGAGNLFAPRPICFAHGARMLKEPIFYRPPYSPIKVCEYLQCSLGEVKKKMKRLLSHSTARWMEDRMWPCVWLKLLVARW